MPSFFDPGHGFLSSIDEVVIAALAVLPFVLIGAVAEYVGDAKGWTVLGALVGYVVALFVWAPPVFAGEWHYAVVAAVPVVLLVYLYRGRRDRS
jgi:hypothetical protein